MRSMKRIMQVATIAFVFFLWAPVGNACWSCWCVKPELREAFDKARVVFVGEVVEVIQPRSTDGKGQFVDAAQTIRFRVETAWKEHFRTEVTVLARVDGCFSLRMLPQKGEKYLVYAEPVYPNDPSRTELKTDSCTRTVLLSEMAANGIYYRNQAADDIRILNNFMLMFAPRPKPVPNLLRPLLEPDN